MWDISASVIALFSGREGGMKYLCKWLNGFYTGLWGCGEGLFISLNVYNFKGGTRQWFFLLYFLPNFWADFCYTWQFLEKFVIPSFVILRNFPILLLYLIGYTWHLNKNYQEILEIFDILRFVILVFKCRTKNRYNKKSTSITKKNGGITKKKNHWPELNQCSNFLEGKGEDLCY